MIALGSDHGGFELKEQIKLHLSSKGVDFKDFGTDSEESISYVVPARAVSKAVLSKECELGILVCGTGIGISIAANRAKGIRAAVCTDAFCTKLSRLHNNANVLCLGGRVLAAQYALELVDVFLNTKFEGGRHLERINSIDMEIEEYR